MQEIDISTAVAGIEQLKDFHSQFIGHIKTSTRTQNITGIFNFDDDEITAICLDTPLSIKHKYVVRNNMPAAIEYSFSANHEDESLIIFIMYLESNGILYTDYETTTKLCDYNNTYVANNILTAVAKKLLTSAIFAPTVNG